MILFATYIILNIDYGGDFGDIRVICVERTLKFFYNGAFILNSISFYCLCTDQYRLPAKLL